MYHSGTSWSRMASTQPSSKPAFFTLPLRTFSMILKAHLGVQALGDQVEHDVVPAAHRLQNGGGAADDQILGVAQPHVRAVGEAGEPQQRR